MTGAASPRRNRVLPTGEIVADPARGLFTGNRGILVDAEGQMTKRRWTHKAWICCTLEWKGRKRPLAQPGTWTELFFLDEAVAMAAGHRPCGYCRRPAYRAFGDAWQEARGARQKAPQMDTVIHAERVTRTGQKRDLVNIGGLPDGSLCLWRDAPHLVLGPSLLPYAPGGYGMPIARPVHGRAKALTPPSLRACLAEGYRPVLHPSASLTAN